MAGSINHLSYELIAGHRRTGQILAGIPSGRFARILALNGISRDHADECIDLFNHWYEYNWDCYQPIDQWWRDGGHRSPRTPTEAVNMLCAWRSRLN